MLNFQAALPTVVHTLYVLSEHQTVIDSCLLRIFLFFGVTDPVRLFRPVILRQIMGIEYQSHYRQSYPEISSCFSSCCSLHGADMIMEHIGKMTNSMASWKLTLIQASMIRIRCPHLLCSGGKTVADTDVTTLQSSSSQKEGAEAGYNKKNRGKPCFQLSATFVGKFFADAKIFPGCANPKDFFQKAVKRAMSPGFGTDIVRAGSAYMTPGNLLFLTKLSPGYAIGAPPTFKAVKDGKELFKKLARKKSSAIIHLSRGVAVLDLGEVTLRNGVRTRIVTVRRISRKRKNGRLQVNTCYYAITGNLKLSAKKLYTFYHKRQCIEAGFRELKNHCDLERLPFQGLKANEFRILCKIMAMTLFKIFQEEMLPKSLRSLLRKTLFRRIFQKGLRFGKSGKLQAAPRTGYTWHLRRLLCKTDRMKVVINACQ